jgi:23S rRNA pseudouridine2605 synthase
MTQAGERLQKVLARAGVASRRAAEELIVAGRVSVNGRIVTELGTRVVPGQDVIAVDGERLPMVAEELVYVMLNKPRGVLSAVEDARGRRTVTDLVNIEARLFPVGRLDLDSEGLVLLTNDGDLAHQMTHPRYRHEKEYEVLVEGYPSDPTLIKWRRGSVLLDGVPAAPCRVERLRIEKGACQGKDGTWLRVIVHEGRKRQIRRVAAALGHPVYQLIRTRIGSLKLGRLRVGAWRHLTQTEVNALRASASTASVRAHTARAKAAGRPANSKSTRRKKPPARKR